MFELKYVLTMYFQKFACACPRGIEIRPQFIWKWLDLFFSAIRTFLSPKRAPVLSNAFRYIFMQARAVGREIRKNTLRTHVHIHMRMILQAHTHCLYA